MAVDAALVGGGGARVHFSAGVRDILSFPLPPFFWLFPVLCVCVCAASPVTSCRPCTAAERRDELGDARVSGGRSNNKSVQRETLAVGGGVGSSLPFAAAEQAVARIVLVARVAATDLSPFCASFSFFLSVGAEYSPLIVSG